MQELSTRTLLAAKEFCADLDADFRQGAGDIVAGWSRTGILLVAARGPNAVRLAHLLETSGLAVADGLPPGAGTEEASG